MAKFKIPKGLVDKCPYSDVQIGILCDVADRYKDMIDSGYAAMVEAAKNTPATKIVRPDVWTFMLVDHAFEDASKELNAIGFDDADNVLTKHIRSWIDVSIAGAGKGTSGPSV